MIKDSKFRLMFCTLAMAVALAGCGSSEPVKTEDTGTKTVDVTQNEEQKTQDEDSSVNNDESSDNDTGDNDKADQDTAENSSSARITDEQAVEAVKRYCHESNPDLESIEKEYEVYWTVESSDENEIVVLFRSYTGAEVRYYIAADSGETYVTEFVQGITEEEERTDESFNIRDYISDTQEEMTDSMEKTDISGDKSSFASGMATGEEDGEITDASTETALNDEIEEKCPARYSLAQPDVKYGEFTHGTYDSKTCGLERGYSILLPADYSEEKQYPVLYLLHGIFGNEYSFSSDPSNKIKEIVGNMAADGLIDETIVVCPNMYATSDPSQQPGFDTESCLPYDNFINDLTNDLMPHIESEYSVLTGRENTYLAGFSMGGRETIFITLKRPELFGYVCAISAAPGIVPTTDKFMTHMGQMEESEMKFEDDAVEPKVFIICCGTNDSVVGTYPKQYHELLEKNGSDHIWYEISGADHDNNAIKSGLYNLFKQIAYDKSCRQ